VPPEAKRMPKRKAGPAKPGAAPGTQKASLDAASSDLVEIDYARLKTSTATMQLDGITLAESQFTSHSDPRKLAETTTPQSVWEYGLVLSAAQWTRNGTQLDVALAYSVNASQRLGDVSATLFSVSARFVASYFVPPGSQVLDPDVMADWVCANGQINVFPYLRQLVADLSGRGGWPPLLLKVLRAPAKRPRRLVQKVDTIFG
jgi:preprotein translocase subunit SecB